MNILVTGGAGFIASHIVDALIEQGHTVVAVDNLSTGSVENVDKRARFYPIDILDDALDDVFSVFQPEIVIHHAAQVAVHASMLHPKFDAHTNIVGTLNVLERCVEHKVRKFIYASSAAVYGIPVSLPIREDHPIEPINGYGISKYTPEAYIRLFAQQHGLDYTILRYANVYGERQSAEGEAGVVSIFIDRLLQGKVSEIYGDGEQTRDFVYVRDVVEANLRALEAGSRQIINIGTNKQISVNELYKLLCALTGRQLEAVRNPERPGDIRHSRLDNTHAAAVLGWRPQTPIEEGLARTVSYAIGRAAADRQVGYDSLSVPTGLRRLQ